MRTSTNGTSITGLIFDVRGILFGLGPQGLRWMRCSARRTLFGYERGAYTGATQSKPGQLEQAAGGERFRKAGGAGAVASPDRPRPASATDLQTMERAMIDEALQRARFNKSKTAKALGLTRQQ
jgi:transcriptional regulator with AAA-type ATPase domain